MGTNYYLHQPACPHCGRGDDPLHIGKSSGGWCFTMHVIPERGINTLDDWRREWSKSGSSICNEYGDSATTDQMEAIITERGREATREACPRGYRSWRHFHQENHSQDGPNGLLRHRIEEGHCIGHGDGTWDYIVGEFS